MYRFVLYNSLGCKLCESASRRRNENITQELREWLEDNFIILELGDILKVEEIE
jgi:hypothetical protein